MRDPPPAGALPVPKALDYARALHEATLDSNKELYTRAQIVLTLDGVVVGASVAALASKRHDLEDTVAIFGPETWGLLAVAALAFALSVTFSALALYSRHNEGARRVTADNRFTPARMWFYAHIAQLEAEAFVQHAIERADADFETRSRLTQVTNMAPIMVRRATFLNRAFASTAVALVFFILAAADYLVRLA
jgi:hypothetical protein